MLVRQPVSRRSLSPLLPIKHANHFSTKPPLMIFRSPGVGFRVKPTVRCNSSTRDLPSDKTKTMPHPPLPADVACLAETLTKFREHAQKGNYALAQRYHEQVKNMVIPSVCSDVTIVCLWSRGHRSSPLDGWLVDMREDTCVLRPISDCYRQSCGVCFCVR